MEVKVNVNRILDLSQDNLSSALNLISSLKDNVDQKYDLFCDTSEEHYDLHKSFAGLSLALDLVSQAWFILEGSHLPDELNSLLVEGPADES